LVQYAFVGLLGAWVSAEYNVAALPQLVSDGALYCRHPIPSWNVCIEGCLLGKNWANSDHLKSTIQAIDTRLLQLFAKGVALCTRPRIKMLPDSIEWG